MRLETIHNRVWKLSTKASLCSVKHELKNHYIYAQFWAELLAKSGKK